MDRQETQWNAVDLKKVSRKELVEILYEMKKREIALEAELEEAYAQLEDRTIRLESAGSIAEASMALNDIFAVAQKTADEYLESIRQAQEESVDLLQRSQKKSRQILEAARQKADALIQETESECQKRIKSTDVEIERRWDLFTDRVEKTLEAYPQLKENRK